MSTTLSLNDKMEKLWRLVYQWDQSPTDHKIEEQIDLLSQELYKETGFKPTYIRRSEG